MSAAKRPRRANGEGSVYFDAVSQRWVAALTGPDGRRRKRTAATRKLANARLHELVEEQHQFGRTASPNATVGELLELRATKVLCVRQRPEHPQDETLGAAAAARRVRHDPTVKS